MSTMTRDDVSECWEDGPIVATAVGKVGTLCRLPVDHDGPHMFGHDDDVIDELVDLELS